jgi:hypothetical protein
MVNTLLMFAVVVLIVIVSTAMVMDAGSDIIATETSGAVILDTHDMLLLIDTTIHQVATEGQGSKRELSIKPQNMIEVIPEENSILTSIDTSAKFSKYFSLITEGNLKKISGGDVDCSDADSIIMENSLIKTTFSKIGVPSSHAALNTSLAFNTAYLKNNGVTVTITDSGIEMDQNLSSINGTGYTELLLSGRNRPSCTVHIYMNGTYEYDAYYTLYSGKDFLVFETKNIKKK